MWPVWSMPIFIFLSELVEPAELYLKLAIKTIPFQGKWIKNDIN